MSSSQKSHIIFPIHWKKNIINYLFLKDQVNISNIKDWQKESYQLRFDKTKERFNKEINFNLSNEEFFKKSEKLINIVIEHDSIHSAIAFHTNPLFLLAKDDISRAELSETKINQMTYLQKIQMIQEEIMVLSLERHIIQAILNKKSFEQKSIYIDMAGRMVNHYLPIFLRHFAADNFAQILDLNIDFVEKFKINLNIP